MNLPISLQSRFVAPALALSALAVGLLDCHRDMSPPQLATVWTSTPAPQRRAPPSDTDVAAAIERHFKDEAPLRSQVVRVDVTQGIATLSGSVGDILAKERALKVAETIKGVRSVVDRIAVKPVARTDGQLRTDVMNALHRDPATRAYAIGVEARNGKVTLSGAADSWQQKTLFADVIKAVPGVAAVENEVEVHYPKDRSEADIAADVKHRFANDVWLDGETFGVTVSGHTVHLSGIAGSLGQEMRASSDAWVMGVDAVDDSKINVDWGAYDDQRHIVATPERTDAQIAAAVRDAFVFDPRLKVLEPQVAVMDGTVTLSGAVDSAKARAAAEADAKNTVGVWDVRNDATVQPSSQPADADIVRDAKRVLADDAFLADGKSIQVSSAKGKVALKGTISGFLERWDAVADVESVPGVAEIDDDLSVQRTPAQIAASIEDRLVWDPMVERDHITVSVAPDGVATLTGTVDFVSEARAAVDDASWGGANHVVDLLKLKSSRDSGIR
ncbi:MAG TPA: BON domain-containing protein [Polyangiaceae bacterium]|jgi:osmotically-inducible protein OsmY